MLDRVYFILVSFVIIENFIPIKSNYQVKLFLPVEAKGVAGIGKAGGDGSGGVDKAGQQVPPEVYIALTYAGTAFLFTLSVPLILYGLNKLLNKIEDCFGCGPSSKRQKLEAARLKALEAAEEASFPGHLIQNQQLYPDQLTNLAKNQSQLTGMTELVGKEFHDVNANTNNHHTPSLLQPQRQSQQKFSSLTNSPQQHSQEVFGTNIPDSPPHSSPNLTGMTLPFSGGANYKKPEQQQLEQNQNQNHLQSQQQQQQLYVIPSPYL